MATEPSGGMPDGTGSDLESEDRRSWLSHGIAALAVSALGLAVAGSVVLTTHAQTTAAVVPPQTTLQAGSAQSRADVQQAQAQRTQATSRSKLPAADRAPAAAAFSGALRTDDPGKTDIKDAIVEERAAQRSEDLAKSAEETAAAALKAGNKARQDSLAATDRARREAAVKLAQERTRKAIQERVAAEVQQQGTTGDTQTTTAPTDPAQTSNIPSGGGAVSPVPGAIVGAGFGATGAWARYHTGLDFRAGYGTPIRAVTSGVVTFAGNKGNWAGNHVVVRHGDGWSTLSAHMQTIAVHVGQTVSADTVIGYVGSTGRAFGAHLHFETYPPGTTPGNVYTATNPVNWLRNQGINTN